MLKNVALRLVISAVSTIVSYFSIITVYYLGKDLKSNISSDVNSNNSLNSLSNIGIMFVSLTGIGLFIIALVNLLNVILRQWIKNAVAAHSDASHQVYVEEKYRRSIEDEEKSGYHRLIGYFFSVLIAIQSILLYFFMQKITASSPTLNKLSPQKELETAVNFCFLGFTYNMITHAFNNVRSYRTFQSKLNQAIRIVESPSSQRYRVRLKPSPPASPSNSPGSTSRWN